MKVLITGGAGFIGSNCARRFIERGYDVVVIDNLSRVGATENLKWLQGIGRIDFAQGDIRDYEFMHSTFCQHAPFDVVLHLAAQVAVTTSVMNPREDFEINALGTLNVLEALRAVGANKSGEKSSPLLIYSSTNKVYGAMDDLSVIDRGSSYGYAEQPHGIGEERQLDFHSPYGCSKGAADQYVLDYARIYGIRTVSFRQSCIYGYRQFGVEDQGWMAWFTIATVLGRPITIFGDGKQVRDVLFIEDLVDLYEAAMRQADNLSGVACNVGGGTASTLSLLELIGMLEELSGKRIDHSFADWRPGDQKVFIADTRKAKRDFGWEPKTIPREGVKKLYQWVVEHKNIMRL